MAVLTISRDLGSGGNDVGRAISDSLGYRFVDRESLHERLRAAGVKWEKGTEGFDEHSPRMWERYDWFFRGFVAMLHSLILDEAASDNVVIMGRGANYLLKNVPFSLRVRIVAPVPIRIERTAAREKIDVESARRLVDKTDRERAGFLLSVYGTDGKDPADYDAVFNSAALPVEAIAEDIRKRLSEKDLLKDAKSLADLQMSALALHVKAGLLTDLPFFMSTLEVEFDGEAVCVRGVVRLPREREMVVRESVKRAGNAPLKFDLKYRK